MRSVSVLKLVGSASLLALACGAVLVFEVMHPQRGEVVEIANLTGITNASEAAPEVRTDRPAALEGTLAKAADITAELGPPPSVVATDPSVPSFDLARVEAGGEAVIAGRAPPGAVVDLLRGGERLDQAVADASGQFVMVPRRLPAGSYELSLSAKLSDGTQTPSKQTVAVTVNEEATASRPAQTGADDVSRTGAQAHPRSEVASQPAKPRESAGLQLAAIPGGAASEQRAVPSTGAKTRVVSRGDSLWRISRLTYGVGTHYTIVYKANRDRIRDPNLIHPGQMLVIPSKRD